MSEKEEDFYRQMMNPLTSIPPPIPIPPRDKKAIDDLPGMQVRTDPTTGISVYTTRLPAGTLLFRGVNSMKSLNNDLYGASFEDSPENPTPSGVYYLPSRYNVYFYPFPLMSTTVSNYKHHIIYALNRDVEIVVQINPSPMTRNNPLEKDSFLINCQSIEPIIPETTYPSGPCFKEEFIKAYPEIVGMIGFDSGDRRSFHNPNNPAKKWIGKYASLYSARDSELPGIPEIILYPLHQRRFDFFHKPPEDVKSALQYRKDNIYDVYSSITGNQKDSVDFIDRLVSKDGVPHNGRILRAQIDKTTGFYVDPSLYSGDPKNLLPQEEFSRMGEAFPELRFKREVLSQKGGKRKTFKKRRKRVSTRRT